MSSIFVNVLLSCFVQSLNKAIALRINKWLDMRKAVAVRAKVIFSEIIERRFKGKINFVHDASDNEGRPKQGKLILEVQTDSRSKAGTSGGANTLSGGEKSYSQICLLISLWDAMSSPIRCLDEFDVFMVSSVLVVAGNLRTVNLIRWSTFHRTLSTATRV